MRSEYDLIIVGSGLSGLMLANLFVGSKFRVCLLEKEQKLFGNSGISTLNFAICKSKFQKEFNIDDDVEFFLGDMLRYGEEFANKNLLKIIAQFSNNALELLLSYGCEFKNEVFLKDNHSLPRVLEPKVNSISSILNPLLSRLKNNNIEIFMGTEVVDLYIKDSEIVGIVLADNGILCAKNVVFATGGFSRDKDFVSLQYPLALFASTFAMRGATAKSLKFLLKNGAIGTQLALMRFAFDFVIEILPYSIIVDTNNSMRLCNESRDRQEIALEILNAMSKGKNSKYPIAIFDEYAISATMGELMFKKYQNNSQISAFKTLQELAKNYSLDEEVFLSQIALYNSMFDIGIDTEFGKNILNPSFKKLNKPLFYALDLKVYLNYTQGGVVINEDAQILKLSSHQPFSNLFAIGEATGGLHGKGRLFGCSSTECCVFAMKAFEKIKKNLS